MTSSSTETLQNPSQRQAPEPIRADAAITKSFAELMKNLQFSSQDVSVTLGKSEASLLIVRVFPPQGKGATPGTYRAEICAYYAKRPVQALSCRLQEKGKEKSIVLHTGADGMATIPEIKDKQAFTLRAESASI